MTLQEALSKGTKMLEEAGVTEASLDAWYLLEHITGISRAGYLADRTREMEEKLADRYFEMTVQRGKRIPLQHLTGVQEFMGLEFKVSDKVLIPRQDTEVLVETALESLKQRFGQTVPALKPLEQERQKEPGLPFPREAQQSVRILDMCTGSGCILLSILYYARQEFGKDCIDGVGADISKEALKIAGENAEKLGVEALLVESDLFTGVEGTFELIVSNPPYIRSTVIEELEPEVKDHEPRLALDGDKDGLRYYQKIVAESGMYLKKGGMLLFEIGHDQGQAVSELMKEAGYTDVVVKKDLAGLDRVVSGRREKGF